MDLKEIKSRLDNGEIIELHNGEHVAQISKSKLTGMYLFVFNGQGLFSYKTFKAFGTKLSERITLLDLVERVEEYYIKGIELKELPKTVEYCGKTYTFLSHLKSVAENADSTGEDILKVTIKNRKRRGMEYLPQFNSKFVKEYYYICEPKNNIRNYYEN